MVFYWINFIFAFYLPTKLRGCFENAYYTFTVKCCFIFALYCGLVSCPFYIILNLYNFFPIKNSNALLYALLTTNLFMCSFYIRYLVCWLWVLRWTGSWSKKKICSKKKNYFSGTLFMLFYKKINSLFLPILYCSAISMIGFVNFK